MNDWEPLANISISKRNLLKRYGHFIYLQKSHTLHIMRVYGGIS